MSWNSQRSEDRIRKHLESMGEIDVAPLRKEANLEQLLSETTCRDIYGAHVYIHLSNFSHLASVKDPTEDYYKCLIQAVHIYERAITRIVADLGGVLIHFQGPKLHALFYRPIEQGEQLATRALLLQLILKDFVKTIFNPTFPDGEDFTIAGGADLGNAIGTMDGINGERELLFLGSPANHAAKIISSAHRLRLTQQLYNALPHDLKALCFQADDGGPYQVQSVPSTTLDTLLNTHGLIWNRARSARQLQNDKAQFPLETIRYSAAETLIDLDQLSIFNNKRVCAASIFADISGFTRYIDTARSHEEIQTALKVLHVIRKETARIITTDFDGLRIQYQGDRIQGLFHLPQGQEKTIVKKVVEAAIGLQSAMEYPLKACLPQAQDLRLSIGIDMGTTLVSKLGARGQRDRICLGEAVERAAQFEERSAGGQIAISTMMSLLLPNELTSHFHYSATVQGYVSTDLTAEKVARAARASIYQNQTPIFLNANAHGLLISNTPQSDQARAISPSQRYASQP
jgi:class 3 adenylate cyclase